MQVNAMLAVAEGYAVKQLPSRLPLAFQPDLLEADLDPNPGLTPGERAAAEFKNISLHDDVERGRTPDIDHVFHSDFYLTSVSAAFPVSWFC